MKKSEMLEVLDLIVGYKEHHPTTTAIVNAMEAKGQTWDPEVPERLEVVVTAAGQSFLKPYGAEFQGEAHKRATLREAVRRWNAWEEIRLLVRRLPVCADHRGRVRLLAILDGKEGE